MIRENITLIAILQSELIDLAENKAEFETRMQDF